MTSPKFVIAVVATLAVAGCADPFTTDPGTAPAEPVPTADVGGEGPEAVAVDLVARANDERAARGVAPVEWDDQLARLATDWSHQMAEIGVQHRDLDEALDEAGLDRFVAIGENIFSSTASVPAGQAHLGWMASDGHRSNLLSPAWDRVGIGVFCAPDGQTYITQNFGRTAEASTPAEPGEPSPEQPVNRPEPDGPSC